MKRSQLPIASAMESSTTSKVMMTGNATPGGSGLHHAGLQLRGDDDQRIAAIDEPGEADQGRDEAEAQRVVPLLPQDLECGLDQQEDRDRLRARRGHQAGTPAISSAMRRAAIAGSGAPVIGRPITK